jgi:hypothetical protein
MAELPIPPPSPIRGTAPVAPPAQAGKPRPGEGGLAFEALLERLDERTRQLAAESRKELSQDELPGAVEQAKASLEELLSLQDRLLEAWRAARQGRGR